MFLQRVYLLLMIAAVVMTATGVLGVKYGDSFNLPEPRVETEDKEEEWNLLLVNRENPLPDDYKVTLVTLANDEMVDERILPSLQAMFDDARSQGIDLYVRSGYRSSEDQAQLYEETVQSYLRQGYDREEAERLTDDYVLKPGESEHATGLAVDINTHDSGDQLYLWLSNYAHVYGFVQRYPSDKYDITHVANEPWHYRYVGEEAAAVMKAEGLCLEEYLEKYQ